MASTCAHSSAPQYILTVCCSVRAHALEPRMILKASVWTELWLKGIHCLHLPCSPSFKKEDYYLLNDIAVIYEGH